MHVAPDDIVTFPGTELVTVDLTIDSSWTLCIAGTQTPYVLPGDLYPETVSLLDVADNVPVRAAFGLATADVGRRN